MSELPSFEMMKFLFYWLTAITALFILEYCFQKKKMYKYADILRLINNVNAAAYYVVFAIVLW